jgi:hypothetical protein
MAAGPMAVNRNPSITDAEHNIDQQTLTRVSDDVAGHEACDNPGGNRHLRTLG